MRHEAAAHRERGVNELEAMQLAGDAVVARQIRYVAFPKRFTLQAREIWTFQERLKRRSGKRAELLVEHPRFRAAYDLLLLREQCGEDVGDLADWWTRFQQEDPTGRRELASGVGPSPGKRRRPRKRRRSNAPSGQGG